MMEDQLLPRCVSCRKTLFLHRAQCALRHMGEVAHSSHLETFKLDEAAPPKMSDAACFAAFGKCTSGANLVCQLTYGLANFPENGASGQRHRLPCAFFSELLVNFRCRVYKLLAR